jgi:hypothetical protein
MFPLRPVFENGSVKNAALHLKMLDFELKSIPSALRLAIATGSFKGAIAKHGVIAS